MSMDILSNYVDAKKLYLLPDMAFFVDVEAMPMRKVRNDCILFMLRTDSEIDDITFKLESDFDVKIGLHFLIINIFYYCTHILSILKWWFLRDCKM